MNNTNDIKYTILLINLSTNEVNTVKIPYNDERFQKYLGGVGLVTDFIMNHTKRNTEISKSLREQGRKISEGPSREWWRIASARQNF